MRPASEWALLGRPVGEWLFLALLTAQGINGMQQVPGMTFHGPAQLSVVVAQFVASVAALGVVVFTIAGRRLGLACLWIFASRPTRAPGLACNRAPMASPRTKPR